MSLLVFGSVIGVALGQEKEPHVYSVDFEPAEGFTAGGRVSTSAVWAESGPEVVVTDGDAATGLQSVKVPATEKVALLRGRFEGLESPVYVDLQAKLAGESHVAMERFGDDPAHTVLTKVVEETDEAGLAWAVVYVMNGDGRGDGEWVSIGVRTPVFDGYPVDWLRMTFRVDYRKATWSLYIDRGLAAADINFVADDVESFTHFSFHGDKERDVYLDAFAVGDGNLLFDDGDNDGISDHYERLAGSDAGKDDRDSDADGNGRSLVEDYMAAIRSREDSDGDGMADGLEIKLGRDPNRAEEIAGVRGAAAWEKWDRPGDLESLKRQGRFASAPSESGYAEKLEIARAESGTDFQPFASRLSAYLVPETSGEYRFWIAGDDHGELWLSTSDSEFDRRLIARLTGFTSPRQWDDHGSQKSGLVSLEAGRRYYLEVLHRDLHGEDHIAVAWQPPGGARRVIGGRYLESYHGDPLDRDRDGLPDDWERRHGLAADSAAGNAGSSGDADGDFLTNHQEYLFGTDPGRKDDDSVAGLARWEVWSGVVGEHIRNVTGKRTFPGDFDTGRYQERLELYMDDAEQYGSRMRGYLVPEQSGEYRFWLSADNKGELWLSGSESKFDKNLIAWVQEWTRGEEWTKYPEQKSEWMTLEAGRRYYIEALHKEVVGEGHVEVGWQKRGEESPRVIPATLVERYVEDPADSNDNGLPDDWEREHGLQDPLGEHGDADGDHVTNPGGVASWP